MTRRAGADGESSAADGAPLFSAHGDLARLLEGAHHRKVVKFGAPALVRMIGLWRPWSKTRTPKEAQSIPRKTSDARAAADAGERAHARETLRLGEIDLTIASVYRALRFGSVDGVDRRTVHCDGRVMEDRDGKTILSKRLRLFGGEVSLSSPVWKPLDDRVKRGDRGPAHANDLRALYARAWCPDRAYNPHRSIRIGFAWHGIECHFLFELHAEFLSILVVLDFANGPEAAPVKDAMARLCSGRLHTQGEEEFYQSELFDRIWIDLENAVRPVLSANRDALGERFADFRGIVLTPPDDTASDTSSSGFRDPYMPTGKPAGSARVAAGRCRVTDLEPILNVLTRPRDWKTSELTLSSFLIDDDEALVIPTAPRTEPALRALFASTVRPPLRRRPTKSTEAVPSPQPLADSLHYILYADPANRWQLGRLVYRINRAGINRIAATMHYDKLNRIGRDLNDVERLLERGFACDEGEKTEPQPLKTTRELAIRVQERLDALFLEPPVASEPDTTAEDDRKEQERTQIDGPLEYRIERSRSYVSQWTRVAEALRIGRIEGYQPYDEFVDQRLGAAFDFIDRLGRRYERVLNSQADLQRRLSNLEARAVTEGATKAAQQIERLQRETKGLHEQGIQLQAETKRVHEETSKVQRQAVLIQEETRKVQEEAAGIQREAARIQAESARTTRSIEKIQEVGEVALFAVLAPYYGGYILAAALEGVLSKHFIWFAAILSGAGYAYSWLRSLGPRKHSEQLRRVAIATKDKSASDATEAARQARQTANSADEGHQEQALNNAKAAEEVAALARQEADALRNEIPEIPPNEMPGHYWRVPVSAGIVVSLITVALDRIVTGLSPASWPELVIDKALLAKLHWCTLAEWALAFAVIGMPLILAWFVRGRLRKSHRGTP